MAGPFDISSSLLRILFFHSILHPDHLYSQTWPYLLVPIYHIVATEGAESGDPYQAEADAFWAFGELMTDLSPILGNEENDGNQGILSYLRSFSDRLKWADEELFQVLVRTRLWAYPSHSIPIQPDKQLTTAGSQVP